MKKSELKNLIKEIMYGGELKPFAAFKDHVTDKWKFYKLNLNPKHKDFYVNVDDKNMDLGFDKKDVEKYRSAFIFGNSVEEIKDLMKKDDRKRLIRDKIVDIIYSQEELISEYKKGIEFSIKNGENELTKLLSEMMKREERYKTDLEGIAKKYEI